MCVSYEADLEKSTLPPPLPKGRVLAGRIAPFQVRSQFWSLEAENWYLGKSTLLPQRSKGRDPGGKITPFDYIYNKGHNLVNRYF